MKYMFSRTIFVVLLGSLFLPFNSLALGPGMMNFNDAQSSSGMMRYIEDRAIGNEAHEEMEELMVKVMAGTATQEEANRIAELMNQYPAVFSMMSNRMMGGASNANWGWGMMGG